MKRNIVFALILIVIGFLMFLRNYSIINIDVSLLLLSFAFLGIYIFLGGKKKYSNIIFLVCFFIMLTINFIGSVDNKLVMQTYTPALLFFILSLDFLIIFFHHNFSNKEIDFNAKYWPLFVCTILLIFAFIFLLLRYFHWMYTSLLLRSIWPVTILLMAGFILISNILNERNNRS